MVSKTTAGVTLEAAQGVRNVFINAWKPALTESARRGRGYTGLDITCERILNFRTAVDSKLDAIYLPDIMSKSRRTSMLIKTRFVS